MKCKHEMLICFHTLYNDPEGLEMIMIEYVCKKCDEVVKTIYREIE